MYEQFGEHYLIDAYGCDFKRSNDKKIIIRFINEIVKKTGMKKISDTNVFDVSGNGLKDSGGVTGFVVVDESHVSIHTFPHRLFISADIYTCKIGMDVKELDLAFKKYFAPAYKETQLIKRGVRFPDRDLI